MSTSELSTLTQLVQRLDLDLTGVRRELAAADATLAQVEPLRTELGALRRSVDALTGCLERGLVVDEDSGRARCTP